MPLMNLKPVIIESVTKLIEKKLNSLQKKLIKTNPDLYEYGSYQLDKKCCEVSKEYQNFFFAYEELIKDRSNMGNR